ncbi:methanogenesis marker 2 protein [Methanofollis fontis]|uniref:Methanogenesis marker 2 protein n=1 Tax=Methanofollis fontis TaxID=2052832 RepID=A0A483CTM0_9EURY|nr:methanogenesis marker 2 protein [Methanofollis fontis]TAJ44604.1 methanogenesis marker 2 protein [Methanofollis fontis]
MTEKCSPDSVARSVREYEGVTRKRDIGELIECLRIQDQPNVVASFGEDAAVIRQDGNALLLAADGIWSKLMEADPFWAGYCAVLVNVHDIAAMGGTPLAMVDVLSFTSSTIRSEVTRGMQTASAQFGVPIVGGHLHPDTPYSVIDVAILGTVRVDDVIYSSGARPGDRVIAAIDLDGRVHPSCILNWDSVTMKSAEEVREQIGVMQELARRHLVTAGKDISNPGVIGTLGMLLEVSKRGAVIELDAIPRPDLRTNNITFEHWVRMYPGMGFILTCRDEHTDEVCRLFREAGMNAAAIGWIDDTDTLSVSYEGVTTSVFDLKQEGIMRILDNARLV